MTRDQLLDRVPPCGLMCYTCPAFEDGAIQKHARALLELYQGYFEFLGKELPEEYRMKAIDEHEVFHNKLMRRASPGCPGCRKAGGKG